MELDQYVTCLSVVSSNCFSVVFVFCSCCIYLYVLCLYDLFHTLLLILRTYGTMECMYVCFCVRFYVQGPLERFVDWPQYAAVMLREAVTRQVVLVGVT